MNGQSETEMDVGQAAATTTEAESEDGAESAPDPGAHLDDIEDGCGCAEVWEHMSDRRAED